MRFLRLARGSLAVGFIAVLLWVIAWSVALPDVWVGYGDHTMTVFWLSSGAFFAHGVKQFVLGQR